MTESVFCQVDVFASQPLRGNPLAVVVGADALAFSAADPYLFVFCRWGLRLPRSTRDYPSMYRFFRELAEMPAVSAALAQQAVTLEGPASGPG